MMSLPPPKSNGKSTPGIDPTKLRLAAFGTLVVAAFVALFSRLWFLQVLASEDYQQAARNNRMRVVHSEPPRGRILDRHGRVLVDNRRSLGVTVDRQIVDSPRETRRTLGRLSRILSVPKRRLRDNLVHQMESPYKPVVVAQDVREGDATRILENRENFPGVDVETLPVRKYLQGDTAAHILGYVGEISKVDLKSSHFRGARPPYGPGDMVGKTGLEYFYDRLLRGRASIRRIVVNSTGEIVGDPVELREEAPGSDLVTSLDARVQKLTEQALQSGIMAARGGGYKAPAGGVVVMRPSGRVVAMASYPTYSPARLADGITNKEWNKLGHKTPKNRDDDALFDRAIQSGTPPGSTFKIVTAGAALAHGIATPYTYLPCPGQVTYAQQEFNNWTSADFGSIGFPRSLEISCDTFYYELGWRLESRYGVGLDAGDGTERFQDYMRLTGFGHETGIDLPYEFDGRVPDEEWCQAMYDATRDWRHPICEQGWLPGYTVNMSIGQGDLLVTPLQMAVAFAAIANGGEVVEPRIAMRFTRTDERGKAKIVREVEPKTAARLPLDETELGVIRQGLVDVISSGGGTAASAFAGFPLDRFPVSGKTGTAQIGSLGSGLNYAWFVSYAPSFSPRYVVAVYLEKAGHGGESAAPVARQILEGIFRIDQQAAEVHLGQDESG